MLDTIKLTLQDVSPDILKQHERFQMVTSADGEIIRQQAIQRLNETPAKDIYGVKQKQLYNGTLSVSYDYQHRFLNIGCSSLPALLHGTSFATLDVADMKRVALVLQSQIEQYVDADINRMFFTRLDNSTIYTMQHSPAQYICLLDSITRNKQYRHQKHYFEGETLQFRNRQRTIGVYDKYQKNRHNEVEMQYLKTSDADNEHTLRYEIQYKKASEIRKVFKTEYLKLPDIQTDAFIETLTEQRKHQFEKHFRFVSDAARQKLETLINIFTHMEATRTKQTALNDTAMFMLVQTHGLDAVKKLMEVANFSRQAIHKRMQSLRELEAMDISKAELYNELQHKIQTDAA